MKNKFLFGAAAALALLATACSKDSDSGKNPETGEKSVVSLTIYDATSSGISRAAGSETDAPAAGESEINASAYGIKVIVFNTDGSLAYPAVGESTKLTLTQVGSTNQYKSQEFSITSGEKYFYVFANDKDDVIPATMTAMNRTQFIARMADTSLDGSDGLNIAPSGEFLMGTLWSDKVLAPGGGTVGNPATVSLTIGRLASKVTVSAVAKGSSNILGEFSAPQYRLGTIPKKIFVIGSNNETTPTPPAAGHGVVISAVHNTPASAVFDATHYMQYSDTWQAPDNSFYTVENTTAPDSQTGQQLYGNTTYIQIETVYTPHVSEVYNPADLTAKGSFDGPDFYTARIISTGEVLIFDTDPRGINTDIDDASTQHFVDGKNYHKFPVYDPQSGLADVQKNAVLRNHSYIYKVTNIKTLGSSDKDIDPTEPIESLTTLELEVEVAPWSKIIDEDVTIG